MRISLVIVEETATLKVEGKLLAPWVPELLAQCDAACRNTSSVALDLGQLSFVDAEGLAAIRELLHRGIALRSCGGFVHQLLLTEAL